MLKKIIPAIAIMAIFLPDIALAAEKSSFHIFYERTFGPIGAIAGIIAMVALWQIAKKVEPNFGFALKMFVVVLLFINIGSISFGVHGSGILSGETSRYIERVCRLIALLAADIMALMLFIRIDKRKVAEKKIITINKNITLNLLYHKTAILKSSGFLRLII